MNLSITTADQMTIIAGAVILLVTFGVFIYRAEVKTRRKLQKI